MNKTRLLKRIISLLTVLVLTLALMPINILTLKAGGADEIEEPEMTETITDDTPAAADDTGNSYDVSYDSGDYSVPAEQSVNDVPYIEAVAQAAEPVTVPTVEPAAEPIAERVTAPAVESVTESGTETDKAVTVTPEKTTDEPGVDPAAEALTDSDGDMAAEEAAEMTDESSAEEMAELAETVTYTVTFDANGHGTAPADVTAEQDATISEPDALSEDGYTFTGWYKEAAADELWDFAEDKVTEDITLYAGWIEDELAVTEEAAVTFTVSFDANGHGTAPEAVIADEGALITEPAALSEDGYTFTGWYKDAAAAEKWDFSADKILEDITLYAGWYEEEPAVMFGTAADRSANIYSIEYVDLSDWLDGYPPDGDYMTGNWPENSTAAAGTVVSLPPIIRGPYPVEKLFGEGYVTYTWEWLHVVPRGSGNSAADNILDASSGTFVMPESDVIVRGAWTYGDSIQVFPHATKGGSVSHDGRNASWAESSYITLTAIPDPDYYFVGWKHGDESNPSGPIISTQNPWRFQATQDVRHERYWAVFAKQVPHSIKIYNGTADKTSAKEGETITITATEPSGNKVFDTWWAEKPSTLQFADENSTQTTFVMPRADVEVWATYKDLYSIIVQESEGGTGTTNSSLVAVGGMVTLTATPNGGWRFDYWEVVSGDVELADSSSAETTLTLASNMEDVIVKPHFYYMDVVIVITPITVQESEGGTGAANPTFTMAPGETVTLTATPRGQSYYFDHWEVISGGVVLDDPYSAETTFVSNGNAVIVKPVFKRRDVVVVINPVEVQESEGGTGAANPTFTMNAGETVSLTATPENGYVFDHWEVVSGGVTLDDPNSAGTTFVSNGNVVVVKPHFVRGDTEYSITYNNLKGASNSNPAAYTAADTPIQLADLPDVTGFTFDGWYDNADYNGNAVTEIPKDSTGNKVFYAKWTAASSYSVTVVGGTADKDTAMAGETVTITANEAENGYAFVQWAMVDGIDYAQTDAFSTTFIMPAKDVTVTAVFKEISLPDIEDQMYTGEEIKPTFGLFDVMLDGVDVAFPSEYVLSYRDNINAGKATVILTFRDPVTGKPDSRLGTKSTTFNISPAELTITGITASDKVYDGTNTATVGSSSAIVSGLVSGDDIGLTYTGIFKDANAGSDKTVTVTVTLTGQDAGNYIVKSTNTPTASITRAPLTITVKDQTHIYDGNSHGEHNTVYNDTNAINEKVEFSGLQGSDALTRIVLDGSETGVGVYQGLIRITGWNAGEKSGNYEPVLNAGTLTIFEYIFSVGEGSAWTKGSSVGMNYTIHRSFEDEKTYSLFENIEVDGAVIDASNYSAAAGSLKVTLNASYLNTLANGSHTVKINFRDGSVETALTIRPKPANDAKPAKPADPVKPGAAYVPNTADKGSPIPWASLLYMFLVSLAGLLAYRRSFTE